MVSQLNARHKPKYRLLTFYKFVDIPESALDSLAQDHLDFCRDIGLRGRVYLGTEGISSTVTGNTGQVIAYKSFLGSSAYFRDIPDIDAKSSIVDDHQFPRMSVKIRNEIVTMGVKVTEEEVKKYHKEITPEAFKKIVDEERTDEYLILDMRNDYEYRLGHFKGAIPAGTVNFRDVPNLLDKYKNMAKGRKIIWYCTGGIRCEKAAVLANMAGLDKVYAIEGGVVKYTNTYNDGNWLGNLYTFDGRISSTIGDEVTHAVIGECLYTGEKTDNCENCRYAPCNARIIATHKAFRNHLGLCSKECYLRARKDGLMKVVSWDKLNYMEITRRLKSIAVEKDGAFLEGRSHEVTILTEQIEALQNSIEENLDRKLFHVEWRYHTSQKEKEIIEC